LAAFYRMLSARASGRTDGLRFLLSYLGLQRRNPSVKRLVRSLGDLQIFNFQLPFLQPRTSLDPQPRPQGALP
jgi:hypothetical protein